MPSSSAAARLSEHSRRHAPGATPSGPPFEKAKTYAWEALKVAFSSKREIKTQASPRELAALEVVREMLYTVGIINPLAYVVLAIQYVRRAEHAGSPVHSALALTTRGWFRALHGSLPKALLLIDWPNCASAQNCASSRSIPIACLSI